MWKQPSTLEEYFDFHTQQSSWTSLTERSNLEKNAGEDKVAQFFSSKVVMEADQSVFEIDLVILINIVNVAVFVNFT